jgi:hypothetical protein
MKGRLEKRRQDWQRQLNADKGLMLSDLKVGIAITWYINRTTGEAFPAMATLAKETGYCERTIIRSVKRLEARGHLYVKRDSRRGDWRGGQPLCADIEACAEFPTSPTSRTNCGALSPTT